MEDALRDRFVCGVRSQNIQKRLLSEPDLTFAKACTLALANEAAEKNVQDLNTTEVVVQKVFSKGGSQPKSAAPTRSQTRSGPTSRSQNNGNQRKSPKCQKSIAECYRCGSKKHKAHKCRHIKTVCHNCHKIGHLARVCHSSQPKSEHHLQEEDSREASPLFRMGSGSSKPITVSVQINQQPVEMELDTGAARSVMSETVWQRLFSTYSLRKSSVILCTYSKEKLSVLGEMEANVSYEEQQAQLTILVVKGDGPTLLGRDWLSLLRLNWKSLTQHHVKWIGVRNEQLQAMLEKYQEVFREELGTVRDLTASITVKEGSQPKFFRPRSVPFAIKEAVGAEIDRLEAAGILEKVNQSEWAAPIVAVPKKNGTFRLCGDYKVTINTHLAVDQHPLPTSEEIFATLAGGKRFTKLDLSQAYQQIMLDDASKDLVTINTHKGLYRYTRLPYGVASAPAIFQRTMDRVLQGLPRVMCYIDDILVSGENDQQHLSTLAAVLERLKAYGFRIKKEKCAFLAESVEYLGFKIDASGIHPTADKLKAIEEAPTPQNVSELRSFLGLLNYYGKFIPRLSTLIHPLNQLLQKDRLWAWNEECQRAFQSAKEELMSDKVLVHYDLGKPLYLATDASAYGVGAVISHRFADGSERPIAYASRTLSKSEQQYSQLEKEALSIIFGVKRFHSFLYGRPFTLVTDHKPLTTIFHPGRSTPTLAAARLQRWAITLSAYRYSIQFKNTLEHANADAFSRLPIKCSTRGEEMNGADYDTCFNLSQISSLPVTAAKVAKETSADPVLKKVVLYVRKGWPERSKDPDVQAYWNRRQQYSLQGNCLLLGTRVVIPSTLRLAILEDLHHEHPGMTRMKAIARSYFWWPKLDQAIEELVSSCDRFGSVKSAPSKAPLHPWVWPERPWQRLHVDFAGPFRGKMFFLVLDAHSKWPIITEMSSVTSQQTLRILFHLFATYGLPEQIVSDNGPQFVSDAFRDFMKKYDIKHIRTAPYHPASNGAVERLVQTFKQAVRAMGNSPGGMQQMIDEFLFTYRTTPHSSTGETPCQLFLGRQLRTHYDLLYPDPGRKVRLHQASQKAHHDSCSQFRELNVGNRVSVKDARHPKEWKIGTIVRRSGPVSYVVKLASGQVWKKHIDHIRGMSGPGLFEEDETAYPNFQPPVSEGFSDTEPTSPVPRYPTRLRRPVERLEYK